MPRPGDPAPKRRCRSTFKPVSSKTSRMADSSGCSWGSMKPPGRHHQSIKGSNLRFTRTSPPSIGTKVAVTGLGLSQWTNSQDVQAARFRPPISTVVKGLAQRGHVFTLANLARSEIIGVTYQAQIKHYYCYSSTGLA